MAKKRIEKVNVLPHLRDLLAGNCDTTLDKDKKTLLNPPTGTISLNAQDFEAFEKLCAKTKTKPQMEIESLGARGAMVGVIDLYNAITAAGPDLEIPIDVEVEE